MGGVGGSGIGSDGSGGTGVGGAPGGWGMDDSGMAADYPSRGAAKPRHPAETGWGRPFGRPQSAATE